MTEHDHPQHIEVEASDQPNVTAEVSPEPGGTARASLHHTSGHAAPGSRAGLVDAVMDLPDVQSSTRLEATIPLGDDEALRRLRERTENSTTRAAGSTALVDADIPPPGNT
ncbi:MAG TPA: hypothetical protein VGH27_21450 [Streptosporangiaceae bacterium]|jgi:hypothetical protein